MLGSLELIMNPRQQAARDVLQNELRKQRNITEPLPDLGVSDEGYAFTEVDRVTVCIGPRGGYILPAVRSYRPALQAAVDAGEKFKKNKPGPHGSGHNGGIVKLDWRCGSPSCGCQKQSYAERFDRSTRKGGR